MKTGKFKITVNLVFPDKKSKERFQRGRVVLLPVEENGAPKGTFWRRLYAQNALLEVADKVVDKPKEVDSRPVLEETKEKFKKKKKKNKDEDEK